MVIKNALVYGEDSEFHQKTVFINNGLISDSADGETFDAHGSYLIPGLTDIHLHGCLGLDFCDGEISSVNGIARYEARRGVTQICPTTMTVSANTISQACRSIAAAAEEKAGADIIGVHLEGPFVSAAKRGAQNEAHILPADPELFRAWNTVSNGMIKQIDLAPEEPGAMDFIRELGGQVVVSLGHTAADYATAMAAFAAGARHVTHTYNAMLPFLHRAPGVVGAASDTESCRCELICDGFHVAPSVVRATFRMLGKEKLIMISDSILTTGMTEGDFLFGGQPVTLRDGRPYMPDGSIAGSCANLMDCVRSVVSMGVSLETAIYCAAVTPAKEMGIFDSYGSISAGKKANLALLRPDLSLEAVMLDGRFIGLD